MERKYLLVSALLLDQENYVMDMKDLIVGNSLKQTMENAKHGQKVPT